jgi:hypothetical protein
MASVPGELHGGTIPRGEDEVGSNGDTEPERFRVLAVAGGAGEVLCLGGGGWSKGDPASGRRRVEAEGDRRSRAVEAREKPGVKLKINVFILYGRQLF